MPDPKAAPQIKSGDTVMYAGKECRVVAVVHPRVKRGRPAGEVALIIAHPDGHKSHNVVISRVTPVSAPAA